MNKKFYFKSYKTKVTINGETITVSRKGFFNLVLLRLRTQVINLNNIQNVKLKEATNFKRGYLKFVVTKGLKHRNVTVIFNVFENEIAVEMKNYIQTINNK
ncbi:hypothetical protein [Holzapfeliella floricola]|uniref:hypothetical protein n=1 Tax=Holzapfeliella floricola TaxID=679249 RepID=UPI0007842563|nr:hypothetical protein [Holzapfeliella floricola]